MSKISTFGALLLGPKILGTFPQVIVLQQHS